MRADFINAGLIAINRNRFRIGCGLADDRIGVVCIKTQRAATGGYSNPIIGSLIELPIKIMAGNAAAASIAAGNGSNKRSGNVDVRIAVRRR